MSHVYRFISAFCASVCVAALVLAITSPAWSDPPPPQGARCNDCTSESQEGLPCSNGDMTTCTGSIDCPDCICVADHPVYYCA
jgi:hypothetical protein